MTDKAEDIAEHLCYNWASVMEVEGSMSQVSAATYGQRVCKALRLMAEGWEPEAAAHAAGVRHKTMHQWQQNEDFRTILACMRAFGRMRFSLDTLNSLTPEAVEALRRLLQHGEGHVTAQVARDIVKWAREVEAQIRAQEEKREKHTVHVVYDTPDRKPISSSPWAERNPVGE